MGLMILQARLRFFIILALIGGIALSWNSITARWEKWTRPPVTAHSDIEYYCPMHPQIVRDKPGEKCPICGMPVAAERKKEAAKPEELPPGVLSRVQLTRYREQLAGIETAAVTYRPLVKEIRTVGFVEFDERQLRRISARVKGRIDKLYVNVTDQMVEAGQDLASLYSPDLAVPVQNLLDARRSEEKELNNFLSSVQVLSVDRQFVDRGENSFWAICVDYLPSSAASAGQAAGRKGRIDYREVLPPEQFAVFAKLRDLRKQLAQAEAVPVYTIFTNDQLAEMVRRRVASKADLEAIAGVGDARVSKYGPQFLALVQAAGGNRETSGQPH